MTSSGDQVGTDTAARRRVISPEAAGKVSRMMEMVTTEGAGTAPGAGIAGYRVAGKTGTAQQVGAKCRCYDGSLAVSFAGFAPADNPRFTVYVVIQKPGCRERRRHRRTGVPQDPHVPAAEVRRAAHRHRRRCRWMHNGVPQDPHTLPPPEVRRAAHRHAAGPLPEW